MATGDFNGDGIPDLAVANASDVTVSIMLGNSDGTFQAAHNYPAGSNPFTNPQSVAVGDFNGDGYLDLAVANSGGTLVILLGNGDGSFRAGPSYVVGEGASFVVVGDFNGDGMVDLALAVYIASNPNLSILLGNGDGSFQAGDSYAVDAGVDSIAVGDFNGDGHLDLAVTGLHEVFNKLSVFLSNGDGTFQAGNSYAVGAGAIAAGDFNSDGHLDLSVAESSGTLSIFLGNGDGTFQAISGYAIDSYRYDDPSLVVGDFNGDGHLDLALTDQSFNGVRVFLGNGDGTFHAGKSYAAASVPSSVVMRDFNGDGLLDLAVANFGSDTVSVLLGEGNGTFTAAESYDVALNPVAVAVRDFNGDGHLDLAMAVSSGAVNVLLGNGDGTFQAAQTYAAGSLPIAMVLGDFNGDGIPDLAVANGAALPPAKSTVSILFGNGDGTFGAAAPLDDGIGATNIAVADFNGDGKTDIVTANFSYDVDVRFGNVVIYESDLRVFLGNGDGTFQPAKVYAAGPSPTSVTVGDFNGDGVPDLAVADAGGDSSRYSFPVGTTVSILLGNGDGTFQPAQSYAVGNNPMYVAVGDFNGDGKLDLAVANFGSNTVSILLGNGDGTFMTPQDYAVGSNPLAVTIGDFNGDGIPDLAVATSAAFTLNPTVGILLGNGDGTFQAAQNYAAGSYPTALGVGGFNGDGFLDVAVASAAFNGMSGSATVLLNTGHWRGGP
jgi:hypothetical protein